MTSFGHYQTVREIHHSGFNIVYSARTVDSSETKYAIKVFQPSTLLLETEQVKTESNLFLNSASVQQKTFVSGAQKWAPIHKYGSIPDGAYYATDKYDRSLQQLIDARIALTAEALLEIIESVTKGLVELKKACGRPHGNLKASNVLIAGEGDISQTRIVLSDPLPDEHIDTTVHWDGDLRDIAEFIYQLIIHRPSPNVDGWQAPDSKQWAKLGKQAQEWRNLCNRLLVAHMKPAAITIETLIEELARLKKIKPVLSSYRLLIATSFLVFAVVTIIGICLLRPRVEPATLEDWNRFFTEYVENDEHVWIEKLIAYLKEFKSERKKQWAENPDLEIILENLINKDKAYFPFFLAERNRCDVTQLKLYIKDQNDLKTNGVTLTKTKASLKAVEIIKYFFVANLDSDPNSFRFYDPKEYKKWPVLEEMQKIAEKFEEKNWQRSATYLQNLVNDIQPDQHIADNVDKILEIQNNLPDIGFIEDTWQTLEENQKIIENTRDPILAKFPEYIHSELGSADIDILRLKLEDVNSLADMLATFDWQKVIKELFNNDPNYSNLKNRSDALVSKDTFNEWLLLAKKYQRIEDPREGKDVKKQWDITVKNAGNNIGFLEAEPTTKAIAGKLRKELEEIEDKFNKMPENLRNEGIFLIVRDEKRVQQKLDSWKEILRDIASKADFEVSKLIPPSEWLAEQDQRKVDGSKVIHDYWLKKRDSILTEKVRKKLRQDDRLALNPVRGDVEDTWDRLNRLNELAKSLDRNFAEALPLLESRNINNIELQKGYFEGRENVFQRITGKFPADEVPDINDPESFIPEWQQELDTFRRHGADLASLVNSFYTVHKKLEACYLLDDELIVKNISDFRNFYSKLRRAAVFRGIFAEQSSINGSFQDLTDRIARLEEIEKSNDRQTLVGIALDDKSYKEAVYAAWLKLGEFSDPQWPAEPDDFNNERKIRNKLNTEFGEIDEFNRKQELLTILADITLERKIVFKKASIGRFIKTIEQNYAKDKILNDITRLITTETNSPKKLPELEEIENLANRLAYFVSQEDWQKDKFRKDLFRAESNVYKSYSSVSSNDLETTVEDWLKEIQDYKKVVDPREGYQWDGKINEITQLIEEELRRKQGGGTKQNLVSTITGITKLFEKALGGEQTDSEDQSIKKLKQEYDELTKTVQKISAMHEIPAIEKNKNKIDTIICNKLWEDLINHEAVVRSIIKPKYCERLELLEGEVQRLVFATTTELSADFEPVNINRLQSITEKEPLFRAVLKFVQGTTDSLLGLSRIIRSTNILPLSQLEELFNKTVEVAGWDDIRQGIKDNRKEWVDFFHKIDVSDTKNVGWPKFIRSKEDQSVILRFIPAGSDNPEPFYMATHEITNAQYRLFLEKTGARSRTRLSTRTLIVENQSNKYLIQSDSDYKACGIKWDNSTKTFMIAQADINIPVVYVTYFGAQSYAEWLGGQLPTASQHKYACKKAGTNILHPWANDQEIANYAHLRASDWLIAKDAYNSKLGSLTGTVEPPVGAVKPKDFVPYDKVKGLLPNLDNEVVNPYPTTFNSAWPVASATNPNDWDLYDMIGNVWEWCQDGNQSVICGGSCLTPPEYIHELESNYILSYNDKACDVGFRIIVPAR